MNYQPQVISRISEPSTASTWPTNVLLFLKNLHPQKSNGWNLKMAGVEEIPAFWIFWSIFSFQLVSFREGIQNQRFMSFLNVTFPKT